MRLKHRIGLTIFALQTALIAVVVATVLGLTVTRVDEQAALAEDVHLTHLGNLSRAALLTEDYAELQVFIEEATAHPRLEVVIVVDVLGQTVASTVPLLIGAAFEPTQLPTNEHAYWRRHEVLGRGQELGVIEARFTRAPLVETLSHVLWRTVLVGFAGLILSAGVAWLLGHWLAERLGSLARATSEVTRGAAFEPPEMSGSSPEMQELAHAIGIMVSRLQGQARALRTARDRLIVPTESMAQGFALWDAQDRLVLSNCRLAMMLGLPPRELTPGLLFTEFADAVTRLQVGEAPAEDALAHRARLRRARHDSRDLSLANGRTVQLDEAVTRDGGIVGIYTDVTERRQQALDLARKERRLSLIMGSVLDGVVVIDGHADAVEVNPAAQRLLGINHDRLRPSELHALMQTEPAWNEMLARAAGGPLLAEGALERPDGTSLPIELAAMDLGGAEPQLSVLTIRDITSRRRAEDQLRFAATHDPLTGLANRGLMHERIDAAVAEARRRARRTALLFLDLDGFKLVNDTHGHIAGDALLAEVGARVQRAVGPDAIVGRLGGDEFAVLLTSVADWRDAGAIADRAVVAIADRFRVANREIVIGASAGVALFPDQAATAAELVKAADTALYAAKRSGGQRWRLFRQRMAVRSRHRLELRRALAGALDRDELRLHYQPQYSLDDRRLVGFEALLRWTSPSLGTVGPDQFVPVAEETGLIREIGLWVLKRGASDLITLRAASARPVRLSINVSPVQLTDALFANTVFDTLGDVIDDVALELTERVLMEDRGRTRRHLDALSAAGLPLVLDDFGTGYSSLNHLRNFRISEVKIDRSFIADLHARDNDAQLLRGLIKLCADLRLDVTAEGIETEVQLAWLRNARCAAGQGYLFARPMPLAEAVDLVAETSGAAAHSHAAV